LLKTKEQLEEEKKISLSFRIKPLDVTGLSAEVLKKKAAELWEVIIRLETEKYDLEERQKRQDYDVSTIDRSFSPNTADVYGNLIVGAMRTGWGGPSPSWYHLVSVPM